MEKIKIALAEDQELLRESLSIILGNKPDMELIGVAEDGEQLIELVKRTPPHVILMDVRMPKINGVECTKIIKEKYEKIKVLILTTFEDDEYVFDALTYGASGYLLKGISSIELTDAIKTVYKGGTLLNPGIATKVCNYFAQIAKGNIKLKVNRNSHEHFNKNEVKIIQLIGMGMSNKEITEKMNFSEGTIRNYISMVLNKTGLRDRTQIAIYSVQTGIAFELIDD